MAAAAERQRLLRERRLEGRVDVGALVLRPAPLARDLRVAPLAIAVHGHGIEAPGRLGAGHARRGAAAARRARRERQGGGEEERGRGAWPAGVPRDASTVTLLQPLPRGERSHCAVTAALRPGSAWDSADVVGYPAHRNVGKLGGASPSAWADSASSFGSRARATAAKVLLPPASPPGQSLANANVRPIVTIYPNQRSFASVPAVPSLRAPASRRLPLAAERRENRQYRKPPERPQRPVETGTTTTTTNGVTTSADGDGAKALPDRPPHDESTAGCVTRVAYPAVHPTARPYPRCSLRVVYPAVHCVSRIPLFTTASCTPLFTACRVSRRSLRLARHATRVQHATAARGAHQRTKNLSWLLYVV